MQFPLYSHGILSAKASVSTRGGRFMGGWSSTSGVLASNYSFGGYFLDMKASTLSSRFSGGSTSNWLAADIAHGLVINHAPSVTVNGSFIEGCGLDTAANSNQCKSANSKGLVVIQSDGALISNNYVVSGFGSSGTIACELDRQGGQGASQNAVQFFHNMCVAQGAPDSTSIGVALGAIDGPTGTGFWLDHNIIAVLSGKNRHHIADVFPFLVTPQQHSAVTINNNLFLDLTTDDAPLTLKPMNQANASYYLRFVNGALNELDSVAAIHGNPGLAALNNRNAAAKLVIAASPIRYLAPSPELYKFSKDGCISQSGATDLSSVPGDFFGTQRPQTGFSTIGPYECTP